MDREGFKFDLITQRFIKNRWNTTIGRKVREDIIDGITHNVEIRAILDRYVLEHKSNIESYGYPYYPVDAMEEREFWVLNSDDLRGIHFYSEDFQGTQSLEGKSLNYSYFSNCNLSRAIISELSYAHLEKCNLYEAILCSGGFSTKFINCNLQKASFWNTGFIDPDFSGSDLRGAYFETTLLIDIKLNYLTIFDENLTKTWRSRTLPEKEQPDILRSIRLAYEHSELWDIADRFLFKERIERRKHIIWPQFVNKLNTSYSNTKQPGKDIIKYFGLWLKDIISSTLFGYGTKPERTIFIGLTISIMYALLYFICGTPVYHSEYSARISEALYFSFTTFATLGYGDISYGAEHPWLRLISTSEAWIGAICIALFVTALARKLFR